MNETEFKQGKNVFCNKGWCLMRVCSKCSAYEITQKLVDLIKGKPLHDYLREVLDDYKNLFNDVGTSTCSKRYRLLSGTPVKNGQGFSFIPDNVQELQVRHTCCVWLIFVIYWGHLITVNFVLCCRSVIISYAACVCRTLCHIYLSC